MVKLKTIRRAAAAGFCSLLLAGLAEAQSSQPNCLYKYRFTNRTGETTDGITVLNGATSAPWIDNTAAGCVGWQMQYSSEGFTVISLNLQSATRNFAGVVGASTPGTVATFAGTAVVGTLPLTSTTGDLYIGYGFYPNIRVNLATATGTGSVEVVLQGWKSTAYARSITPSTSAGGGTPPPTVPGYTANQVNSGGGVEYISGLIFSVGAAAYSINGVPYTSPLTNPVTLTTADATNPRIDVIGVDNTGAVFVSTGTPAASPQQPTVDPSTQLGLTFVYVAALATTPTNISATSIYEENTEWTSSVSANVNAASTSNPYRGTKDIEFTSAVITNSVTLTKPAAGTTDLSTCSNLAFYIRSKAQWPTGNGSGNAARSLNISWLSGSTQIGTTFNLRSGVMGFDSSILTAYQQVVVPLSLFNAGSTTVTALKIAVAGTTGTTTLGLYLDGISLQCGTVSVPLTISPNLLTRPCEIVIGGVGTGAVALANDNDAPAVCGNKYGAQLTITSVECRADAGTPTVTPIITGGGATSILTGALTCGAGSFTSGTLAGIPIQASGASIDGNITSAGGTAVMVTIRVGRSLPPQ